MSDRKLTTADYPLAEKRPELIKGPRGAGLDEISLDALLAEEVTLEDLRITPEALRLQADVSRDANRGALGANFDRAAELSDDPLQSMLIGLKLMAELLDDMSGGHPGCIVATAVYQDRLFDRNVHEANRRAVLGWRARFREMFERIAERYPMREDTDLDQLADFVSVVIEGGIITSRALGQPAITAQQVLLLRSHVKMLFTPSQN